MSVSLNKKLIVVIGGTGAQGIAVINALLAPSSDGSTSPYSVRAVTRDPESNRAKELRELGVEIVQGSFMDFLKVGSAFDGAYGAFVNTDGGTVGEEAEIFAGMRIFELAKQKGIKHYVWSNLDYVSKKTGYKPEYRAEHYDGKGRVADWLKAQPSEENGMRWSVLTSGPYMEMLQMFMFGPLNKREDGTFVFASPVGTGHVLMVSLKDLGFFSRYIYDHPGETSSQDLEIASDIVAWPRLVDTFIRITGQKAVYVPQTLDEWFSNFEGVDIPFAHDFRSGFEQGNYGDKTTFRTNFAGFWNIWRDDVLERDMEWVHKVNPKTENLEMWMRRVGYMGSHANLLKNLEADSRVSVNHDKLKQL